MTFKAIDDATAVIIKGGVYQEVPLAERNGRLFAEISKGRFVLLRSNGSASLATLRIETLEIDTPLFKDQFGRLCVSPGEGRETAKLIAP